MNTSFSFRRVFRKWISVVLLFVSVAALFHFSSSNIADGDSFLYIREAWRLRTGSLIDTSFPWFRHTIIEDLGVSLWYGFFIVLIPFTWIKDLTIGIKVAGVIFTGFALCTYYWISRRESFVWPFFWPFVLFGAAPNTMFRFLMVRMQILSVPLSALLLWFLSSGHIFGSAFTSFAIVWVHGNFAWLPGAIFVVTAGAAYAFERRLMWREGIAVIAGSLAGWFLRPHPFAAAKVFYAQIVEHSIVKRAGLPILFGAEHFPLLPITFFRNFLVFAVVELIAVGFFVWCVREARYKKEIARRRMTFLGTALVISFVFFILTMFFSRRAYDFWIAFGALFIGGVTTLLWSRIANKKRMYFAVFGVVLLGIIFGRSLFRTITSIEANGYRPDQEKAVALWMANHSDPGDRVFNIRWTRSPQLFFWNQKNYYVGGFDPIFEYAKNKKFYWKYHYLALDHDIVREGKTCNAPQCTLSMLEDIYPFIEREMGARFVLVEKYVNPQLTAYLSSDARFKNVFETVTEAVFEIQNTK